MIAKALVIASVVIQTTTVLRSLLLLRGTGRRRPWVYFVAAFSLMLVAMSAHLLRLLTGVVVPSRIPAMELAMLPISLLLALGVHYLLPALVAIERSEGLEASLGALLDDSLHELLVLDIETHRFLTGTRGIREGLGYSLEELRRMGPVDLDPSLTPDLLKAMLDPLTSGVANEFHRVTTQRRKDGTIRPVEVHLRRGTYEGRRVAIIMILDLTRRMEAEAAARRIQDRLEEAQQVAHVATWEWDLKGNRLHWSDELFRIFGMEPGSLEPGFEEVLQVMAPECRDRMRGVVQEAVKGKRGFSAQYTVIRPSGERRRVQAWARMELDPRGSPQRLFGVSQDITELRETEDALRASEARLRTVMENAPVILFAIDADGFFTMSEGRGLAVLGLKPGEVVGAHVEEIYGDQPRILASVRRTLLGEEVAETLSLGPLFFDIRYMPVKDEEGEVTGLIGVATDITDVLQAQDQQRKLAALVDRSRDFIGLATLEGQVLYLNPAGCEISGIMSPETLRDLNIRDFTTRPEEAEEAMRALQEKGFWSAETALKHNGTGEAIPVSAQAFMVLAPETREPLAIATVMRDLREEKAALAEKERMERLLRQSQKMETIGTLAGGIAHDFNNLLTPILGWSELIRAELGDDHPAQEDLREVEEAANRAKELVRQILSFSRQGEQELRALDPGPVVDEAIRLLRATLPSSIQIEARIQDGCGWIRGDPTQIHQVVMNLGANALHAMKGQKGSLGVELVGVEVDEAFAESRPNLQPGPHVRLTVSDTGVGMDPDIRERVLEPFFTTKEVGEGTGLGLSVVHGIVTAYRGDIGIYSEPQRGTRVSIYLPVVEGGGGPVLEDEWQASMGGGLRILFVDDQPEILSLVKRMLKALGHQAVVSPGSREALTRFRASPQAFDLLVTDYTMPEMDGLELAREVRTVRPDLPVVLASGFSEAISADGLEDMEVQAYLPKPFVARELDRAIRVAVGEKG